jgi:hypothetical protein
MKSLDLWLCMPGSPRKVAFYLKAVSLRSRNAHVVFHHFSANRDIIQIDRTKRAPTRQTGHTAIVRCVR